MHDERLGIADTAFEIKPQAGATAASEPTTRRDRTMRRVVVGLSGLLGAAWALVIASRYYGFFPS